MTPLSTACSPNALVSRILFQCIHLTGLLLPSTNTHSANTHTRPATLQESSFVSFTALHTHTRPLRSQSEARSSIPPSTQETSPSPWNETTMWSPALTSFVTAMAPVMIISPTETPTPRCTDSGRAHREPRATDGTLQGGTRTAMCMCVCARVCVRVCVC